MKLIRSIGLMLNLVAIFVFLANFKFQSWTVLLLGWVLFAAAMGIFGACNKVERGYYFWEMGKKDSEVARLTVELAKYHSELKKLQGKIK